MTSWLIYDSNYYDGVEGEWITLENGIHLFVEKGKTKKQAISEFVESLNGYVKKYPEDREAYELEYGSLISNEHEKNDNIYSEERLDDAQFRYGRQLLKGVSKGALGKEISAIVNKRHYDNTDFKYMRIFGFEGAEEGCRFEYKGCFGTISKDNISYEEALGLKRRVLGEVKREYKVRSILERAKHLTKSKAEAMADELKKLDEDVTIKKNHYSNGSIDYKVVSNS